MPYPYISPEDLRHLLGRDNYRRLLDDNNDGEADDVTETDDTTNPAEAICRDASAKVAGYLRGTYDLDAVALNTPSEVKRLSLSEARILLAQRHPEVMRIDWEPLSKLLQTELSDLARGKTRLDVKGSPEPAANTGGEWIPDGGEGAERTFVDGFGDF